MFDFGKKEEKGFFSDEETMSPFGQKKDTPFKSILGRNKNPAEKALDAAKNVVPGFQDEPCCASMCPKLTYKQRLIGFCGCAGVGWILSLMGCLILVSGGMPPTSSTLQTFIAMYVVGNFICLTATGFLLGPAAQWGKMWAETRRFSTAFYLAMLIIVFAVAIAKQNVYLVLFLLFIEILAAIWYSASYIPFGRKIIIGVFKNTCCKPCCDAYEESKGGGGGK